MSGNEPMKSAADALQAARTADLQAGLTLLYVRLRRLRETVQRPGQGGKPQEAVTDLENAVTILRDAVTVLDSGLGDIAQSLGEIVDRLSHCIDIGLDLGDPRLVDLEFCFIVAPLTVGGLGECESDDSLYLLDLLVCRLNEIVR